MSTPNIVLICALQFGNFLRFCLSPRTTSRTISFSISNSFWYKFDAFFRYWLSTRCPLFWYALISLGRCAVATVAVCGFGSWALVFHCGLPRQISPSSASQTEVCSTMGESIRPSSCFYNPMLSANKHVVQVCRFSLSAAADGLADGSGERQTSPFNSDAQS